MSKLLFQTIQFNISTEFSSIRPIDRHIPGATTSGQSGPGSNDNKGAHRVAQRSNITEASPSDCLGSYPEHSLGECYSTVEMQLVHSTASADWAT